MSSIFKISNNLEEPMEWYKKQMESDDEWEYDEILNSYHLGEVYISIHEDYIIFEDMREEEYYGWETDAWIELAGNNELIYAYYNDDLLEAEFIHIKNKKCIREFREYDMVDEDEMIINEGEEPPFSDWVDVASWADANMK